MKVGIIGAGNLGRSLISGLLNSGLNKNQILASNKTQIKSEKIKADFGIETRLSNTELVNASDIVILGVKPQNIQAVCREISSTVQDRKPLIISLAAGLRTHDIERWLGNNVAVVRTMSNTPALIRKGATAMFANSYTSQASKSIACKLLRSVGEVAWVKNEDHLDTITPLISCGPAYFFLIIEILQKNAEQMGIEPQIAAKMAMQTALGSIMMASQSDINVQDLRRQVTTPNGVTERAINQLTKGNVSELFFNAMEAGKARCVEFGQMLGKDEKPTEEIVNKNGEITSFFTPNYKNISVNGSVTSISQTNEVKEQSNKLKSKM